MYILLLPALSSPTIMILCSSLPNIFHNFENRNPILEQSVNQTPNTTVSIEYSTETTTIAKFLLNCHLFLALDILLFRFFLLVYYCYYIIIKIQV